jgi:hypothetical protein
MATTAAVTRPVTGVIQLTATFTAENDAVKFQFPRCIAMSIQTIGTHGSATINIQGSNDDTTYAALPTAVQLTTAGIKSVALADLGYRFYRVIELAAGAELTAIIVGMEAR